MSTTKKLHFTALINAPRRVVWDTMLGPETYKEWTAEFAPGSYYEGSWDRGARIRFLGPDGGGMAAVIAENRPHEFLSIQHLGMIKDGVVDTESEEVKAWGECFEQYTLRDVGSSTEVGVAIDVPPAFEQFMDDTWPRALARLKALCEARAGAVR
jgi:uncharacterized protein YndB with AHSA1/START domain